MKKILTIILLTAMCLPMLAGLHTYTDESVLKNGSWVKIRVSESGVCRMSFDEIRSAGLNPTELRVYGFGGAMLAQDFRKAKIDDLPQVPVYIGEDYVLFWVQGPISWTFNGVRFVHTRNTYSDYGYYFLTDNVGKKMAPMVREDDVTEEPDEDDPELNEDPVDIYSYPYYQVHELDSLSLIDRSGVCGGGREFYGEQFTANQKRTFRLSVPNAITDQQSRVYIDLAGYSSVASSFSSTVNGSSSSVNIKAYSDYYTFGCPGNISMLVPTQASEQEVQITYNTTIASGLGWLNYIEFTTPSALQMNSSFMPIRSDVNYKASTPVRFHLSGAKSTTQVWDVTNLNTIGLVETTMVDDDLQWTSNQKDGVREFVAIDPEGSSWVTATIVGPVTNQNLHGLKNIDYVIICPEGYEAISTDLAKAHEAKEGITWAVVTDQQVYNEFSSGTPDASAYRWLMKMLYDRAEEEESIAKPRWLLLVGHGSFDNRKLLNTSGTALLLTYQAKNSVNEVNAYASDDYFAFLEDSEGESDVLGTMDIGVGRLPINNTTEAREVVDKLIRYIQNDQAGKWKNQIVYLADDGEKGTHTKTAEESAERVRLNNPDFIVTKIFLDAYPQEVSASGESYPIAKNKVANLLKNGVLFFDYSGHGGYNAITNESIMTQKEIENMHNENMAFWLFATCNFAQFDTGKRCAAESAVLNPNGAAVGILAATRTVYASQNTNLNRAVCSELFAHSNPFHYDATLGEAIARGKNRLGADSNKMPYVLLGDPAIRLNYPTDYQVETLTKIDTLNALSVQKVDGRIIDEDSLLVADFNGIVDITIYDKIQTIPTRDNDQTGGEQEVVNYLDYTSTLFSGKTEVKDGLFTYTFMVPKDIRYNYGNGRIVYYAQMSDEEGLREAVGHNEELVIGGSSKTIYVDTLGPEMTIYLNNPAFRDGDKTYATPRFFADLYDENGINTAGAGIGHDLMLIVDDDAKQTYSLNDYFTSSNDSYQEGQVSYLMNTLTDGPHTLTFRAWDLLNNSTTQSLSFIVEAGIDPGIYSVTTYPNPVRRYGTLKMIVNYDQPDELMETELYLMNTNGQIVWKQAQENPDQISLNLAEIGLTPGIYFYSVRIKSESSKHITSSGKIIVTK